jgi:hypothetical protein
MVNDLLGAEDAIARITQARHDVAMVVQAAVDGRRKNAHIGVLAVQGVDALRAGQQAQELDGLGVAGFQSGDGGSR